MADERKAESDADDLVDGVSRVVESALDLGTAMAKAVAEAASGGKAVEPPTGEGGRLGAFLHYGLAAATGAVGLVLGAAGLSSSGTRPPARTPSSDPAGGPTVRPGTTLRIPLSIENPGGEPMQAMTFLCLGVTAEPIGPGATLDRRHVRFQPDTLTVAPRDFEKLTVFVDTPADLAPGAYAVVIGLGGGGFETTIRFAVIRSAAP